MKFYIVILLIILAGLFFLFSESSSNNELIRDCNQNKINCGFNYQNKNRI